MGANMNMNANQKRKELTLNIIGWTFFIFGIVAFFNSAYLLGNYSQVLWFCYLALLMMGIGILKRSSYIVMAQIYILFIPVLVWNIDFFYHLFFSQPLWGITDYFFIYNDISLGKIVSFQHFFSLPLALYSVYLMKRKRFDEWKLSIVEITILFVITKLFTDPIENINCVFRQCVDLYIGLPYHITWFILYFLVIGIMVIILNRFSFLKLESKKNGSK